MRMPRTRSAVAAVAAGLLAASLAACGNNGGEQDGNAFTVGLLLPSQQVTRYEKADRPMIEKRVKELCPGCTVAHANAGDDVASQQRQMNSMITRGVGALILDPVDAKALRSSVQAAHKAGIPVIAYDRLAQGPISGFASFNGGQVGRLQARALLDAMRARGDGRQIVMMNGDPSSPNAGWFKRGAMSVLKDKVRIGKSYDVIEYRPDNAYDDMEAAVTALGPHRIGGVLAVNDSVASGAISALKSARIRPVPPVTGQDADLDAVQRIVSGDQYMTVYKPFKAEAHAAAAMAVALGHGRSLRSIARTTVDSPTTENIPASLLTPIAVTATNIKKTLVKDGVYTVREICTPKLRPACDKAGLTRSGPAR
ncbi:substrate-binding domain-containing protein [Streptomyces sp. NPDC005962]|uniref:sugar ABC transporter substrate-binding protein n=1 Tax=Streptomyces sp. NPDC005962 TaxID=3154466 RepID=UPI0033C6E86C